MARTGAARATDQQVAARYSTISGTSGIVDRRAGHSVPKPLRRNIGTKNPGRASSRGLGREEAFDQKTQTLTVRTR